MQHASSLLPPAILAKRTRAAEGGAPLILAKRTQLPSPRACGQVVWAKPERERQRECNSPRHFGETNPTGESLIHSMLRHLMLQNLGEKNLRPIAARLAEELRGRRV